MAKIYITDTILRDAHQSQAATRMRLSDMLPACELLDSIGYWSLECWGGATFDACLRFLNEDPWERLRQLRKHMPNTKLQMLSAPICSLSLASLTQYSSLCTGLTV